MGFVRVNGGSLELSLPLASTAAVAASTYVLWKLYDRHCELTAPAT